MLTMVAEQPEPLRCKACGSAALVLAYSMPVYVMIERGAQTNVVVADQEATFTGDVWCRRCGDRFRRETEPDIGTWRAWGL